MKKKILFLLSLIVLGLQGGYAQQNGNPGPGNNHPPRLIPPKTAVTLLYDVNQQFILTFKYDVAHCTIIVQQNGDAIMSESISSLSAGDSFTLPITLLENNTYTISIKIGNKWYIVFDEYIEETQL